MSVKIFEVDRLSVRIYTSEVELAEEAAEIARQYLQTILVQKEKAALLLATGNSQLEFLKALIDLGEMDWSRTILFHLDEYLGIEADSPASFRHYLRERVEKLIKPDRFYYMEGDSLDPLGECQRYSKLLSENPIDLCCLGVGLNGHLAFNEPSVANFDDPRDVKLVKLDRQTRMTQVERGNFSYLDIVPQYALTVTIPAIFAAKKIICLAPGENKAAIVRQMLDEAIAPSCPASILRQHHNATLFLDRHSANLVEF